ncbi:GNAT family N-acetyltransferase [Bacteroides fragilis]
MKEPILSGLDFLKLLPRIIFINGILNNYVVRNGTFIFFLIDNNLAGYCYLDTIDEYTVEIAYGISELYSGKGKGTELIAAIIDVLGKRGVRSVVAWVSEANIGSSKILLKNGFIKKSQSEYRQLPLIRNAALFYLWQREI